MNRKYIKYQFYWNLANLLVFLLLVPYFIIVSFLWFFNEYSYFDTMEIVGNKMFSFYDEDKIMQEVQK